MLSKLFQLRIVPILPQASCGALGTIDKKLLVASGLLCSPAVIRPNAEKITAVNLARPQAEPKLLLSGSRFSNIVTELLKFFRIFPNGNFRRPEVGVIFPSKIIRIRKPCLTKHSSQVMQLNMQGMGGVLNVSVLKQIVDQLGFCYAASAVMKDHLQRGSGLGHAGAKEADNRLSVPVHTEGPQHTYR